MPWRFCFYNLLLNEKAIKLFIELRFNFLRIFFRCVSTVKTLIFKMSEISLAVLPCLMSVIISFSREVINFSTGVSTAERSEEHTSELQSRENLVCRLLLEKK